ncbi:sensor histidine kinase [Saccharopolyspora phatthalungensis]|uniref:histidine kinase n=1 Tax=Saccharopolyspora phatthalungensis TaxID=664693 RepID=A0A840QBP9_9PSEU|nr:sensor histidine kinase [Saccharopolyspora phatthalungensis]MBB5157836.1 signal transduction histidine kinase [Saccharopolyspora phatthalungensis]
MHSLLHDLGHGLATLSYLADGLRGDPSLPGDTVRWLQMMELELDRLKELVELRAAQPVVEVFAPRDLLAQLVAVKSLSGPAEITLHAAENLRMRTDQTLLWRMVSNLVDNAVRAAGRGGRVAVAVRRGDFGAVRIEITDDGPGFGNGPSGSSSLGLGIVLALARRCGADLRIDPAPRRGTRARLVFPPGCAA